MSDNKLIDLGSGIIKSDVISTFAEELFQDFKPGSLILTKDKDVSFTLLNRIGLNRSGNDFIGNFQLLTTDNRTIASPIVYFSETKTFLVYNMGNSSYEITNILNIDHTTK